MRRSPPRLLNTSTYPTAEVREIVRFVAGLLDLPGGVEVEVLPYRGRGWRGRAFGSWSCYVKIAPELQREWQTVLVEGIAHELRHLDQTWNRHHMETSRRREYDCRNFERVATTKWEGQNANA